MTIALTISTLAAIATAVNAADVTTPDNENLAHINNILNGATEAEALLFIEDALAPSTPASTMWKVYFKPDGMYIIDDASTETLVAPLTTSLVGQVCDTRLTLTSATPVTTSDVTAATNIYVTPYGGKRIALYDGSAWVLYSFSEITISLSGQTADKNYDVFVYDSAGTVVAESVVWTNDTTRATALAVQDGVYVKSGSTGRRYVGTYRTTTTIGQCEDSVTKRYVWNYYNRVHRDFLVLDTTDTWTYATATIRPWNNSTTNRVSFVRGVNEDVVQLSFVGTAAQAGSVTANIGIGLDSTTAFSTTLGGAGQLGTTTQGNFFAFYTGKPSEGFHYLQLLERASGATVTFAGDGGGLLVQSGATGLIAA